MLGDSLLAYVPHIYFLLQRLTASQSLLSLTIMRVIQGFASAPLETLVSATISELFFVHQKGKMLSIWNLFVMGGVKLGYVD